MKKGYLYIAAIVLFTPIFYVIQSDEEIQRNKLMTQFIIQYVQSPSAEPFSTAITELSALHGLSISQYNLAGYYLNGSHGKSQDYTLAKSWYEKAAAQMNRKAQSQLGWIYMKGLGVKQDSQQAIFWYTKSANQGNPNAQYALGYIYKNGIGVPVNIAESRKWLTLAAKQHDQRAEKVLRNLSAQR